MRLLIDAGNTRIKWALTRGEEWLESGDLPTVQAQDLAARLAGGRGVRDVWASNVAGDAVAQKLRACIAVNEWHFVAARARQCGVSCGYEYPSQLGSDRWAALIAAWHLVGGSCLVANCGTATTVDALSKDGMFLGGLILPGVELMQRSLCGAAAQLEFAQGRYAEFPRNTADAIFSGAVQAACGAIERQRGQLGDVPVVLSGGAAEVLRGRLNSPLRLEDNLVLRGLWLIAREVNA